MNYSNLNLHLNKDVVTMELKDNKTINVLKYLPVNEKNDIIQLALQNANEDGLYNDLKLDMFFKLYIVYSYTDLEFTIEQKANASDLFDELQSNGIIDCIIHAIPEAEYDYLVEMLYQTLENKRIYGHSIASVLNSFINNLPVNAEKAKEIIDQFNPEDFQQVINFAMAANGNRPIN